MYCNRASSLIQPEALEAALTTAGNKLVLLTRANTSPSSGQHDTDLAICCLLLLPQHLNIARHCSSPCLRGGAQTSQLNATTKLFRWREHTRQAMYNACAFSQSGCARFRNRNRARPLGQMRCAHTHDQQQACSISSITITQRKRAARYHTDPSGS